MQRDDDEVGTVDRPAVNKQFGDLMREHREHRRWSQRRLADLLEQVGLRLDPSAITRIERGTRDVKLAEAIVIANVLEFGLDSIAFSPEAQFAMDESALTAAAIQARKSLLNAIRQVDRMANRTDPDIEQLLIKQRGLADVVDLYTWLIERSSAFKWGGSLGHSEGDNFAEYHNDADRRVKQRIVDAVIANILVSESDLDQISEERRKGLGRGLSSLIPTTLEGGPDASNA
ncbi:helix-turn-helix transcriptional regulator [Mycolicibacterium senegalense]|uniref:helix-turn-helix transcriptional regulator n=1 Tax=Mycolicibacterium TaxID=1866885 RepID=UPI003204E90F